MPRLLVLIPLVLLQGSCVLGTGDVKVGDINEGQLVPFITDIKGTLNAPLSTLPVVLRAYDNSSNLVPLDSQVIVSCRLAQFSDRHTDAVFTDVTSNATQTATAVQLHIPYRFTAAGRANQVECIANSITGSQFNQSRSQRLNIQATESPIVSLCSSKVLIPLDTRSGSLDIIFSERLTANVLLTCQPEPATTAIQFTDTNVSVSAVSATMSYNVKPRLIDGIGVVCSAQSFSPSTQYLHSTSRSVAVPLLIDFGSVKILPDNFAIITNISYKATVILDRRLDLGSTVTLSCEAVSFSSRFAALSYTRVCIPIVPAPTTTVGTTLAVTTDVIGPTAATTEASATFPLNLATTGNPAPITTTALINTVNTTVLVNSTTASVQNTTTATLTNETGTPLPTGETTTNRVVMNGTANATNSGTENITQTGNTTAPPPVTVTNQTDTLTTTPLPPGDTNAWRISQDNSLTLSPDTNHLTVDVTRQSAPPASGMEYIVLTCCAETVTDPRNERLQASAIIKLKYSPPVAINTSLIEEGQTMIENPAWVELAECPCDLTTESCDKDCCCDQDCGMSTCETQQAEHMCGGNQTADWSPLLCTQFETNAYLGLYHNTPILLADDSDYTKISASARHLSNYGSSIVASILPLIGYKVSDMIETHPSGFLSLPSTVYGSCLTTTPLRFLRDEQNSCFSSLTPDLCTESLSRLNVHNYPQDRRGVCDSLAGIRTQPGADTLAPIQTTFLCLDDSGVEPAGPCIWDNGVSPPPTPTLHAGVCRNALLDAQYDIEYNGTSISHLSVTYTLGDIPLITRLSGEQTVRWWYEETGSDNVTRRVDTERVVSTTTERPTRLLTKYEVIYSQLGAKPISYSGNPGYLLNKPLYLGIKNGTSKVDAMTTPSIPRPDVSGMCGSRQSQELLFRTDQTSQCQLKVTESEITDCPTLRYKVYRELARLFPLNEEMVISKYGMPSYSRPNSWLPVLRSVSIYSLPNTTTEAPINDTINGTILSTTSNNRSEEAVITGCLVPTRARLTVLYDLTGMTAGQPIYQIVGARVSVSEEEWKEGRAQSLYFSSEFTRVSPTESVFLKSTYEIKRQADCEDCVPGWSSHGLLYPVSVPHELQPQTLAVFLFTVSLFISMWVLSRPWWQKHYTI